VEQHILQQQAIVPALNTFKTPSEIGLMACLTAIALITLPLLPSSGGYKHLSPKEKAEFIL
jgi:hypothetical protein